MQFWCPLERQHLCLSLHVLLETEVGPCKHYLPSGLQTHCIPPALAGNANGYILGDEFITASSGLLFHVTLLSALTLGANRSLQLSLRKRRMEVSCQILVL